MIILFLCIFLFLGVFYVNNDSPLWCLGNGCPPNVVPKFIVVNHATFASGTHTLSLNLTNFTGKVATINSTTVNNFSCVGNYPSIANGTTVLLSCVVAGVNFSKGESLYYVITFTDGDGYGANVTAN